MTRTHPVHRDTRWPALWPMLYGNEEFVAKGTVLSVMIGQRRVAGPMPVHDGMQLSLWVWPPEKPLGIHLEPATVLWVRDFEFGLEVQDMDPIDHGWLIRVPDRTLRWWLVPVSIQKQAA